MIRVASVPADHPYIRHLGDPDGQDRVIRLEDERLPGQRGWWPPRMLEPEWVERNADRFDVFHVQFGFDGRHPTQLADLCLLLAELGKPLVYTVHDLRNPNHEVHELHERQMTVLVEAASSLLTLTEAAASRIERRFGRRPRVIPHPHIVPLELLAGFERRPPGRAPLVGVHLKSLRANMIGVPLVEALAEPAGDSDPPRVRIDLHEEVWDSQAPGFRADLRCTLEHLRDRGRIELRVHPYFSDRELYEYLAELDVAVLPYRFGSHSGWLEACRDLGTAVVAPDCGCYADQGPVFTYGLNERSGFDASSLRSAVGAAAAATGADRVVPLGVAVRRRQRKEIARLHQLVYEEALRGARRRAGVSGVAA